MLEYSHAALSLWINLGVLSAHSAFFFQNRYGSTEFRAINVYIDFRKMLEYDMLHYHSGSFLGPECESGILFSNVWIDRYIHFQSIDVSTFEKYVDTCVLHKSLN